MVDQLEELFTITETAQGAYRFLEHLLVAVQTLQNRLALIMTLRSDFIGALLEQPPMLAMLQETRYFLGPMTDHSLRRTVVEPAKKQGVRFEAGLEERILEDVAGQEGSLPLLEFALTQLWEQQTNKVLTHQAYDAIGGVEEALTKHADATFHLLNDTEQRLAKKIFLQLVYPGTGQEDTRRLATREELGDAWPLATKLASYPARLLVTGYSETGEQTAEVIHEALIRRWGMLRAWMTDYRSFRTWQERLRQEVRLWLEQERSEATLLRGYRLEEAKQRSQQNDELLSNNEREFIKQSLALHERDLAEREVQRQEQLESLQKLATEETSRRKAEQARVRLRTNALWLLTFLGCVAGILAVVSYTARNQAVAARNDAVALLPKLLSLVALNTKDLLPQRSLLLALEADRIATQNHDPNAPAVQRVLRQLVSETGGLPLPHSGPVRTTTISPDGQWFVTGGHDGRIRFWREEQLTQQPFDKNALVTLEAHTDVINSIRFSRDGSWLASGGWDNKVHIWDTRRLPEMPPRITSLEGFEKTVSDINISADSKYLGAISLDNTLRLWETSDWTLYKTLALPSQTAWAVSFSPDGKYLAASVGNDLDGQVLLWTMDNLDAAPMQLELGGPVWAVAFSPDNHWLAAGDATGKLSLWHLADLEERAEVQPLQLQNHSDNIIDVTFSPQTTYLVTASQDKTLRLYFMADVTKHYPTRDTEAVKATILRGHEDAVAYLAFSQDEHWLLTGSRDNTARLWNMRLPSSDVLVLPAHRTPERRTEISPDGTLLVSGNIDGTVYLQTLDDVLSSSTILGKHDSWVESLAFSPDGTYLVSSSDASGGGEHVLERWTLSTEPISSTPFPLTKDSPTIFDISFSSDGNLLATASADETAQLWDMSDLSKPLAIFLGHGDIVTEVAFSPDDKLLATASFDRFIRLWDVKKPDKPIKTLEGHKDGVRTIAFSPDGTLFVSAGQDSRVKVWSTKTWKVVTTFFAGSRVWAIAFSPDGNMLATANESGTLGLWQVGTKTLEPLQGHTSTAWSVTFSRDGKWLVSASKDGTVRFWPAPIETVREQACYKAGRNLTQEEWREMFGTMSYHLTCPEFSDND